MSTIASQLNWGTSYLINDFYRRFIKTQAPEQHYVLISRLSIILLTVFSLWIAHTFLTTISGAWEFIINASAGLGAVLILRWWWWRINAWSEIAAMIAPMIIYPLALKAGLKSPITLYPVVLGTTLVWLIVTFLTPPVERDVLHRFYRRVHPGGPGWRAIEKELPDVKGDSGFGALFISWISGVVLVYATLFAIGKILFGQYGMGIVFALVAAGAIYMIYKQMQRVGFQKIAD